MTESLTLKEVEQIVDSALNRLKTEYGFTRPFNKEIELKSGQKFSSLISGENEYYGELTIRITMLDENEYKHSNKGTLRFTEERPMREGTIVSLVDEMWVGLIRFINFANHHNEYDEHQLQMTKN